jgi:hypothetical protein
LAAFLAARKTLANIRHTAIGSQVGIV